MKSTQNIGHGDKISLCSWRSSEDASVAKSGDKACEVTTRADVKTDKENRPWNIDPLVKKSSCIPRGHLMMKKEIEDWMTYATYTHPETDVTPWKIKSGQTTKCRPRSYNFHTFLGVILRILVYRRLSLEFRTRKKTTGVDVNTDRQMDRWTYQQYIVPLHCTSCIKSMNTKKHYLISTERLAENVCLSFQIQ